MFPFNFITCEAADELIPLCREHDVGFIAMKPLAGGALDNARLTFKYIFQFKDILPIPGVETLEQIEEIVGLLESSAEPTDADLEEMRRQRDELGTRFCRRCDYCQPCQQGIIVSMVLSFPSMVKRMPPGTLKNNRFTDMMEKAGTCIACGECEARCPYGLPIAEMVAESYDLYETEMSKL
jgi:predicted aldo/keto reductase-like oxidoreductase